MVAPTLPGLPVGGAESFSGQILGVTCAVEETGFAVLRVSLTGGRPAIRIVGTLHEPKPGEMVHGEGVWHDDPVHGVQLKASRLHRSPPTTADGIVRYLSSGAFAGIGPKTARNLVTAFGLETLKVITEQPQRLRTVSGFGDGRIDKLRAVILGDVEERELAIFLESFGVRASGSKLKRIRRKLGASAVEAIRLDPYRLARDVDGFGFKTADALAQSLGIPRDGLLRAKAAVHFLLLEATRDGHCALPERELHARMQADCPECLGHFAAALESLSRAGDVVREEIGDLPAVFLPHLRSAEEYVAKAIAQILAQSGPHGADVEAKIAQIGREGEREFAAKQIDAIKAAVHAGLGIITGGPGTGKTVCVEAIARIFRVLGISFVLCAPTGRAAKRLSAVTGCDASTIHRLLGFQGGEWADRSEVAIEADVVIVDEASMVALPLFARLLRTMKPSARLVLVGDPDQLCPVEPGLVFSNLIEARIGTIVVLGEIHRQAAGSRIVTNAHRIKLGLFPEIAKTTDDVDFYWVEMQDPARIRAMILELLKKRIPARFGLDPLRDCQVLAPRHDGDLGTRELNELLQRELNPVPAHAPAIRRGGVVFRAGDRVLQTRNCLEKGVMNGDLGFVERIDHTESAACIRFDCGPIDYPFADFDQLTLGYTSSVHRAQGSEFPCVIMPVSSQFGFFLRRNLVYTGLTRAKRLAILIGEKAALSKAIEKTDDLSRWTGLLERLRRLTG